MLSPVADAARSAPSAARTGTKSSDSGPSGDLFAAMVDNGEPTGSPAQPASGSQAQEQRAAGGISPAAPGTAKPATVTGDAALAAAILQPFQTAQGKDLPAEPAPQTLPPDPALAQPGADAENKAGTANPDGGDTAQSTDIDAAPVALASVPADPTVPLPSAGMVLATTVIAPQQPADTTPATDPLVVGAVSATSANSVPQQVAAPSARPGTAAAANAGAQQAETAGLPFSATPGQSPDMLKSAQAAGALASCGPRT